MVTKKTKKEEEKPTKKLSAKEIEAKVVELANKGIPLSKIGHALKKEFGVARTKSEVGKIHKILEKNKIKHFPEEIENLIKRATQLRKHFTKNHKDMTAKRGLQMTEARIRKLAIHYKKKRILPKDWTYTPK